MTSNNFLKQINANLLANSGAYLLLCALIFSIFILSIGVIEFIEIISFSVLFILAMANFFLRKYQGKYLAYVYLISVLLIFVFVISTIDLLNLFSVFNKSSVKILFMAVLVFGAVRLSNRKEVNIFEEYLGLLFICIWGLSFVLLDNSPIDPFDNSRHAKNALAVYDMLMSSSSNKIPYTLLYYDFYPNLVYMVSFPFLLFFGKSFTSLCIGNMLFWLPLGYAFLVKILKNFYDIKGIAVSIIALLIFANPVTLFYSRSFLLDYPALCLMFPLIYFYFKSNNLYHTLYSFCTGLIIALGMLIKPTYLVFGGAFVFCSLILFCINCYKSKTYYIERINKLITNILVIIITITFTAGIWYLINYPHFNYVYKDVTVEFGKLEGDPEPYSFESAIYYLKAFFDYYRGLGLKILLVLTLIISFYFIRKKNLLNFSLLFTFIIFYLSATITWNKDYRTLLPAFALLLPIFVGFGHLKESYRKPLSFVFLIIMFFTSVNYLSGNFFSIPLLTVNKEMAVYQPQTPNTVNEIEAYYVTKAMYENVFDEELKESLNVSKEKITNFTDLYYKSLLKDAILYPKDTLKNYNKLIFLKDAIYNDYYLLGIKKQSDSIITANIVSSYYRVGGDFQIGIASTKENGEELGGNLINLPIDGGSVDITFPLNTKQNRLSYRINHTHPSNQLPSFYYNFFMYNRKISDDGYFETLNADIIGNTYYINH